MPTRQRFRAVRKASSAFGSQRIPELRFSATLGREPVIELALF